MLVRELRDRRCEVAQDLLRAEQRDAPDPPLPLALLVLALDLSDLYGLLRPTPVEIGSIGLGLGLGAGYTRAVAPGVEGEGTDRLWTRRGAGSAPSSPLLDGDDDSPWPVYRSYLTEMYTRPDSPLALQGSVPSLRSLCMLDDVPSASKIVRLALEEALAPLANMTNKEVGNLDEFLQSIQASAEGLGVLARVAEELHSLHTQAQDLAGPATPPPSGGTAARALFTIFALRIGDEFASMASVDTQRRSLSERRDWGDVSESDHGSNRTVETRNHPRQSTSSSLAPLLSLSSSRSQQSDRERSGPHVQHALDQLSAPPMVIAAPFSNYASTTSNPATVRSPHFDSPLPPAKNFLSEAERTDLVRRSQKLQAYFGKPLEEDTAEKLLVRPGSFPSSPHEQPYAPSPLGAHDALFSGTSTVFLAEPLSPRTHDPLDDYSPVDSPPAWHSLSSSPPLLSSAQQLREERRRTIAKLQRLLGERVTHIELDTTGSAGSKSSSMGRSSSRIGGLIKGAGDKLKLHKRSSSEIQRDARDEQWVIVDEPMAPSSPSLLPPVGGSLEGLTKSRKMENVFGEVPPASLYLTRAIRRRSDASSIVSVAPARLPPIPGSANSFDTSRGSEASLRYKASIASLRYLVEQDATGLGHVLDEVTLDYALRPSSASDPTFPRRISTASDASLEHLTLAEASTALERSDSNLSQSRKIQKAAKLASFFGTTRGGLFSSILDDLEAAIGEEEGMDEDERAEVLLAVAKLRSSSLG